MGKSMGRKNQGGIYGQDHTVLKYRFLSQKLHFVKHLEINKVVKMVFNVVKTVLMVVKTVIHSSKNCFHSRKTDYNSG